jgi:hypothetical protein
VITQDGRDTIDAAFALEETIDFKVFVDVDDAADYTRGKKSVFLNLVIPSVDERLDAFAGAAPLGTKL